MNEKIITFFIILSILIVIGASIWASNNPDGLEWVAEKLGFLQKAQESQSLMADYTISFINNKILSTTIAGTVGVLLVFGIFKGLSLIIK